MWSADGRQIVYRAGDTLVAATVRTSPAFVLSTERVVLERPFDTQDIERSFDLAPDGHHIVLVQPDRSDRAPQMHVVLNWFLELRAR